MKKALKFYLISTLMVVVCFAIVIFRIFNPWHRWVAIIIYLLSWLIYIVPVVHHFNKKRLMKTKKMKFLKRHYVGLLSGLVFFLFLFILYVIFPVDNFDIRELEVAYLDQKTDTDLDYIAKVISSLDWAMDDLTSSGLLALTVAEYDSVKTKDLKDRYAKIVDHIIILEQFMEEYKYFYQINVIKEPELNQKAFLIAYSAYIAKYKMIFDLTREVGSNTYIETLLNEEIYGIENTYYAMKNRYNHPYTVVRINSGRAYLESFKTEEPLAMYSIDAYSYLFGGFDHTIRLTVDNVFDVFEKNTMDKWLPVQKQIANALGEARITTRHDYFITHEQIEELLSQLEPGDIMFQRRNWYVSNAGMPGFWTHAALYLGTMDEMDEYFSETAMDEFGVAFADYVETNYPTVYQSRGQTIEGKAEGVVMLSMDVSAKADYLAFIRPKTSKRDKMLAVLYAFDNHMKPYDFNFDFSTDDTFVCSEVVYKAYAPSADKQGLQYELSQVAGRWMLAPNDMVKNFDELYGSSEQQNEFVLFLDGDEETGVAVYRDVDEFRSSWERPKYDILLT